MTNGTTPKPNPDLKVLDKLVGTWTVRGQGEGECTYEWMDGGFFLVQPGELRGPDGDFTWTQIIGHDRPAGEPEAAEITGRLYKSRGDVLTYTSEADDKSLTIWFGAKGSPNVYMSSKAGLSGSARGISPYVAAKHGVIGLTKIAAVEYADRNIRVNAVAPGPIETERIAALSDEQREQIVRAVPMARIGAPGDVATTVAWLLSDLSGFVTGVTIPIDGGQLAP